MWEGYYLLVKDLKAEYLKVLYFLHNRLMTYRSCSAKDYGTPCTNYLSPPLSLSLTGAFSGAAVYATAAIRR